MTEDPGAYLVPTRLVDSDAAPVRAFAEEVVDGAAGPAEAAARLYRAVRDGITYDPYHKFGAPDAWQASRVLADGRGFCIPKAALFAAAARASGIPARLGYADVKNHLATRRLLDLLGADLFVWHGYAQLHLDGRWIKATPTFNAELCAKFGVDPLEFDGTADSLFQPFNKAGRPYMEYVQDRGTYAEVPAAAILATFKETYPRFMRAYLDGEGGDFAAEAEQENHPV